MKKKMLVGIVMGTLLLGWGCQRRATSGRRVNPPSQSRGGAAEATGRESSSLREEMVAGFRPDWQRRTGCLRDSSGNSAATVSCLPDSKSG